MNYRSFNTRYSSKLFFIPPAWIVGTSETHNSDYDSLFSGIVLYMEYFDVNLFKIAKN